MSVAVVAAEQALADHAAADPAHRQAHQAPVDWARQAVADAADAPPTFRNRTLAEA